MSSVQHVPPYARERADYAATHAPDAQIGALVAAVRVDSPAFDAGIEAGMRVTHVNGEALADMITWLWEASDDEVELVVRDPRDGTDATCTLERLPGEDWGISFDGAVFDGMRTCVNACTFCFMHMLPPRMRRTLYIRDDDYRLSFLQGNFVTLTNLSDDDVDRIITHRLSPMNVSLHAVSPKVRRNLMGRNAQRGMEVLERLIDAGIEIHAQIVLLPGENDGAELERTLSWCAERPAITSLGIVPLGYTRFQKRFAASFSDDPAAAKAVIDQVRPYQERFRSERGSTTVQLSDEFYLDARVEVPPAEHYDGYPQYYDGIGMIRSYLDETDVLVERERGRLDHIAQTLCDRSLSVLVVSGTAARETVSRLVSLANIPGRVCAVENRYFGGNVDVTGLICGCDLLEQLPAELHEVMLFVPDVMFNADGLTLDGYHQDELEAELMDRGAQVFIASTMPEALIDAIERGLAANNV